MTEGSSIEVSKIQELVYELRIAEVMQPEVITVMPHTSMRAKGDLEAEAHFRRARDRGRETAGDHQHRGSDQGAGRGAMDDLVGARMTRRVETLYSDESVIQAVNRMAHTGYGRIPVTDRSGKLVGIVTRGDIIRGTLRRLELNYREEEIQRYRARHIFQDIVSDRTSLILRYHVQSKDFAKDLLRAGSSGRSSAWEAARPLPAGSAWRPMRQR